MLTDRALQEDEGLHLHLRQGFHRGRADPVHRQPVPGGRRRVRTLLCRRSCLALMVDPLFRAQLHPRVRHTSTSPSVCVLTHLSTSWPSGEMLAYDPDLDKLLPFGTLKTAGLCACFLLTKGLRAGLTCVFSSQPTIQTLPPLTSSVRSFAFHAVLQKSRLTSSVASFLQSRSSTSSTSGSNIRRTASRSPTRGSSLLPRASCFLKAERTRRAGKLTR